MQDMTAPADQSEVQTGRTTARPTTDSSTTKALICATMIGGLLIPLLVGMGGFSLEDVSFGIHITARVAFGFFLLVYFARPLHNLRGVTWFVKYRRTLGLCVAFTLTVHFAFLVTFFSLSEESVFDNLLRLYLGSVGVVALYTMAATSNNLSMRTLGPWWKHVHRFGIHYLWFFFFASYLTPLQKEPGLDTLQALLFYAFLGVMLLGLVLRGTIWLRRRSPHARAADIR